MAMSQEKVRWFLDLDGTVARFYDATPNYLEAMYEQNFFRNLKPYESMIEGIKLFIKQHPDVDVYVLSAKVNGEPPYCETEKQEWLDEYLPEIDYEHRIFTEMGKNKADFVPNGIHKTDILYDDYNKNLLEWELNGGLSIKCHNNVNMKGLGAYGGDVNTIWNGLVIKNNIAPQEIADAIYNVITSSTLTDKNSQRTIPPDVLKAESIINKYKSSNQNLEDFMSNNFDIEASYSSGISRVYYSKKINRCWITNDCFIEENYDSDTFGSMTHTNKDIVLCKIGKEPISLDSSADAIRDYLMQPITKKDVATYISHELTPQEAEFLASVYTPILGEEFMKEAFLQNCKRIAEKEYAEIMSYNDISPYGGEDIHNIPKNSVELILPKLEWSKSVGFSESKEAFKAMFDKGLISKEEYLENGHFSAQDIKKMFEAGSISNDDIIQLLQEYDYHVLSHQEESVNKALALSKKMDSLEMIIKQCGVKINQIKDIQNGIWEVYEIGMDEPIKLHGDELTAYENRLVVCTQGYKFYENQYNSLVKYCINNTADAINEDGLGLYEYSKITDSVVFEKKHINPNYLYSVSESFQKAEPIADCRLNIMTEPEYKELCDLVGKSYTPDFSLPTDIKISESLQEKLDIIDCIEASKIINAAETSGNWNNKFKEFKNANNAVESTFKTIKTVDGKINSTKKELEGVNSQLSEFPKKSFINNILHRSQAKARWEEKQLLIIEQKALKESLNNYYQMLDTEQKNLQDKIKETDILRHDLPDSIAEIYSCIYRNKAPILTKPASMEMNYVLNNGKTISAIVYDEVQVNAIYRDCGYVKDCFEWCMEKRPITRSKNEEFHRIYKKVYDDTTGLTTERERCSAYLADKFPNEYLHREKSLFLKNAATTLRGTMGQCENYMITSHGLDYKYAKVPKEQANLFRQECARKNVDITLTNGEKTGDYCIARYRQVQKDEVENIKNIIDHKFKENLQAQLSMNTSLNQTATPHL